MANKGEVSILVKIKEEGAKALSSVADKLEDMKGKAAAFGAAVGTALGFAVKQYADQEAAVYKLEASLKAQGLEVGKLSVAYQKLAEDLANSSLFGDEQILSAIALGQSFAGNIPITKELAQAVADFAAQTGTNLESAFEMAGKAIGTNTNALARNGVELKEGMTASEKMAAITEQLGKKHAGAAEAQTKGLGSIIMMKKAMGELFESIGKHLAPAITALAQNITGLVKSFNNDSVTKWAAVIGVAATAVAGLVAALGTLVSIMPVIVAGLGVLLSPITLIVGAIAGLAIAWKADFLGIQEITAGVFAAVKTTVKSFIEEVSGLFSDFSSLLQAVWHFDTAGVKSALTSMKERLKSIGTEVKESYNKGYIENADLKKKLAEENAKQEKELAETTSKQAADTIKAANQEVAQEQKELKQEQAQEDEKAIKERERLELDLAKHRREAEKEAAEASEKKWEEVAGHVEAFTSKGLQGAVSSGLGAIANSFLPGVGGAVSAVFDLLSKDADEFTKMITQLFSAEFLGNVMKNIVALLEEFPAILSGIIDFISENMPALAEKLIAAIIGNMPEIMAAMTKMFSDPKFIAELAAAIAKGFVAGIKDAVGDLTEAIRKAFKDAAKVDLSFGGGGGGGGGIGGAVKSVGKALGFAHGGFIPAYAGGGLVDNTLAAVTPGEFVVNRASAQANAGLLQNINNSNGRPYGGGGATINLTINGGLLGDEASARELARAIDEQLYKLRLGRESRSFDTGL